MALSAFGKAFREARNSGDKEFTFNGKRYTTELKDNKTVYPQVTPKIKPLTEAEQAAQDRYDVKTGKKSFDTEREYVPPTVNTKRVSDVDLTGGSRSPDQAGKPMTEITKPGTRTNYENTETSDMTYKKGGLTASRRADGIAQRGKTRGTMVMCGGGYMKGKK